MVRIQRSRSTSQRRHRCVPDSSQNFNTSVTTDFPVIVQHLHTISGTIVPGPLTDTTDNRNLYQTNLIFPFKKLPSLLTLT